LEKFDILDENGNPTGETADKGAPLKDGQYYLGVHAYIYNFANEFLLQRRAFDKDFRPGGWDIHMGHVIAGETSRTGMHREILEEIGISVPIDDIRLVGRIFWGIYHHIIDIYFVQIDYNLDQLLLQNDEVIGVRACSKAVMTSLAEKMDYRPETYRRIVLEEILKLN